MVKIKKWFHRTDVWIFAVLLFAALLLWLVPHLATESTKQATAEIYVDKELVETIVLDLEQNQAQQYTVKGAIGDVTIETKDGQIRIKEAPCNDQICVHTSWIKNQGQVIVCIPSHLLIQLKNGADDDGTDTTVY